MNLIHKLCPVQLLEVTKKSDILSVWLASIQHLAHIRNICRDILTLIQTDRQTDRPTDRVTYRDTPCLKTGSLHCRLWRHWLIFTYIFDDNCWTMYGTLWTVAPHIVLPASCFKKWWWTWCWWLQCVVCGGGSVLSSHVGQCVNKSLAQVHTNKYQYYHYFPMQNY